MSHSDERRALPFILSSELLWSFFPIITILSFSSLSPLLSAGLSACVASAFFGLWILWRRDFSVLRVGQAWRDVLWATVLIGIIFYGLIFVAIQKTTAGNANIFALMEIFWAMGLMRVLKGERLSTLQVSGILLAVMGTVLILYKGHLALNQGNLLIIFATLFPPFGNYCAQRALRRVSSVALMFYRSVVSGLVLTAASFALEGAFGFADVRSALPILVINGVLMFGLSKILWLEGLKTMPISKATATLTLVPAFTLVFAFPILGEIPTVWQMVGLAPIVAGIFMLVRPFRA